MLQNSLFGASGSLGAVSDAALSPGRRACALWDAEAQAQLLGLDPVQQPCAWNVTSRAFDGAGCSQLCWWNATSQSFNGGGCVPTAQTSCGCRHLTDFASQSAPTISTCSASDLLNLSPSDIVTKLRMFLIIICILFGGARPRRRAAPQHAVQPPG